MGVKENLQLVDRMMASYNSLDWSSAEVGKSIVVCNSRRIMTPSTLNP